MSSNALMNTYGNRALTLVKGEGSWVTDDRGNRYLDAIAGIAVCGLGHAHPAVTAAITDQAATLMHTSNLYNLPPQQQLAEKLCELSGMEKVFFSNSGAEANEAAIKLARLYGNSRGIANPTIVVMEKSFHGRTMATLSATGNAKVQHGFAPLVPGFARAPFNDIDAVSTLVANNPDIVAVMVEPIQGEGGLHTPASDYLTKLRQLCDQHNLLLMLDEVQTGNGRTGKYFAYQHTDILPDVVTTAKGLGNGVPIGACLARGNAAELMQPGNHGSTYGGNPLVCAAALATVNTLVSEQLMTRAAELGEQLRDRLRTELSDTDLLVEMRGQGLMIGIALKAPCPELVAKAVDKGLLINVTDGNVVRLLPPLNLNNDDADFLVNQLVSVIKEHFLGA